MEKMSAVYLLCIGHLKRCHCTADNAGIAYLSAAFRIERSFVKDYNRFIAVVCGLNAFAVHKYCKHLSLFFYGRVTCKVRSFTLNGKSSVLP